ncbi:MAG: hypothetical protein KDK70_21125, partial [Myxococcales bacterium]|nr:hypothetical protein [Myxococcales bacterium]
GLEPRAAAPGGRPASGAGSEGGAELEGDPMEAGVEAGEGDPLEAGAEGDPLDGMDGMDGMEGAASGEAAAPRSSAGAEARANLLIERARANLLRSPRLAHRDAKAAHALRPSQTTLQLMGHAGCRLHDEAKARYAHRRLRGKPRQQLEGSCLQLGIDLHD